MTAQIVGFITRDQAGLRAPKSVSKNITPASGGVALHYGGPASGITNHTACARQWKQWQDFHMGPSRGWADIAYTMGVCDHGYAFAGRGIGVRTAAQGTNDGNQRYYAVVWLGGQGEKPTQAALNAFDWCVQTLRKAGAGKGVRPHMSFHQTSCPGPEIAAHAKALDGKDIAAPAPTPPKPQPSGYHYPLPAGSPSFGQGAKGDKVKAVQERLAVTADGDWGPGTNHAFRSFQTGSHIAVDGVYGNQARQAFITKGRG